VHQLVNKNFDNIKMHGTTVKKKMLSYVGFSKVKLIHNKDGSIMDTHGYS